MMYKKSRKRTGLLFFALLLSFSADATPRPASGTSNTEGLTLKPNSAKETLVKSEEELNAAIKQAVPGDVITMQNGSWKDIDILMKAAGTKEKPITLIAEAAGKVIVSGKSSLRLSGEYLIVDGLHFKDGYSTLGHLIQFRNGNEPAHHSRVTNVAVSNFNRPDNDGSETWVSFFGSFNRVDHSFFHGKTSAGRIMTVWRSDDTENRHRIDRNYFKDVPILGKNGAEVIGVGYSGTSMSDSYTVIEYNLLENCNGEGELIGLKSGRNIVRYNTIIKSQGSISIRHGNNNLIEGNFILGGKMKDIGGIRIMGENHIVKNNYIQGLRGKRRPALSLIEGVVNSPLYGYFQVKNLLLEGNTLVDNETNIVIGERLNPSRQQTMPVSNSIMKNNVIVGLDGSNSLILIMDEPLNMVYEGNIAYKGTLQNIGDPGIRLEDPQLKVDREGLYRYTENSVLKNNIIGQPLKRGEVGPEWIKTQWEDLGIADTPYNP